MEEFILQNHANIVWVSAIDDYTEPKRFEATAERAEECLEDFIRKNLANSVWAFVADDYPTPKLLMAVTGRAA